MEKDPGTVIHEAAALEAYLESELAQQNLSFEAWVDGFGGELYRRRNELILDLLRTIRPKRVLEIACAGGHLARLLLDELDSVEEYTCSNFSPRMVEHCRRELRAYAKCRAALIDADVRRSRDLERAGLSRYDALVTTSFEHIQFDRDLVKQLAAGTHFVFSVAAFDDVEHFRTFSGEEEIRARYEDLLEILDVRANEERSKFVVLSRRRARTGLLSSLGRVFRGARVS